MQNWQSAVKKAQQGDLNAFDELVKHFRDMAVGYAYSILGDFQLAEDAAQEAFIRAFHDLQSLKEPAAFPAWFRRIVFKYCDRQLRKKRVPTVPLERIHHLPDDNESPSEIVDRQNTQNAVRESVNSLPEHERETTTLFYINGYSIAEVGEFLEVPVSTVKSRLHSARAKLKERMIKMVSEFLTNSAPDEQFNAKVRNVLEKVPVVSYALHKKKPTKGPRRCPEIVPFPSCLRACLEYRGDDFGYKKITMNNTNWRLDLTYVLLMGTTGAGFRLSWKPGWIADNSVLSYISDDPEEPYRRGLESVGYDFELIYPNEAQNNEEIFRQKIIDSIRERNCPVIARGVIGPPEECIIAGFDEAGDVLIGWNFFQSPKKYHMDVQFEKGGYFRKRNWFKDTACLILPGQKITPLPKSEIYRKAIEWALSVIRIPQVQGTRFNGLAAYTAIAGAIQNDDEFTGKKVKELHERYLVLQDALGPLGEGRWYAHHFLKMVIEEVPCPKEELSKAAALLDEQHSLMWEMWRLVDGPGTSPQKAKLFAAPDIRQKTAELLLKARDKHEQVSECLARALETW